MRRSIGAIACGWLLLAALPACGDEPVSGAAVPVTQPEWTGEAPPISAHAGYGISSDVVVAASSALHADPFLLEVLGPDFEIVGEPGPVVEGTEYITGMQFTVRTPEPVVLPPGMPTWKGRGEGDSRPLEPILTDVPSEPATYFMVFVRTDYSIQFLNPLPDYFGDHWAAATTSVPTQANDTAKPATDSVMDSTASEPATVVATEPPRGCGRAPSVELQSISGAVSADLVYFGESSPTCGYNSDGLPMFDPSFRPANVLVASDLRVDVVVGEPGDVRVDIREVTPNTGVGALDLDGLPLVAVDGTYPLTLPGSGCFLVTIGFRTDTADGQFIALAASGDNVC